MDAERYRAHIDDLLLSRIYSGPILNNSHRGDVVEMMVLDALGPDWKFVGLGWHPWDLQRGSGGTRVRIQVKQCALLQLWGTTKQPAFQFSWSSRPPSYFERDNPGEAIEDEGYFCELFVHGLHLVDDPAIADQRDVRQWQFSVVPAADLKRRQSSMVLHRALERWPPVAWEQLGPEVERALLPDVARRPQGT